MDDNQKAFFASESGKQLMEIFRKHIGSRVRIFYFDEAKNADMEHGFSIQPGVNVFDAIIEWAKIQKGLADGSIKSTPIEFLDLDPETGLPPVQLQIDPVTDVIGIVPLEVQLAKLWKYRQDRIEKLGFDPYADTRDMNSPIEKAFREHGFYTN